MNSAVKPPRAIELWPLERLKPYVRNARTHSDDQIEQIAASIREFGFTNPILVASDSGILAGHGRLAAARKLNLDAVPVIVLDHLTEAQRRAYVLADNKLALNAGWDETLLAEELAALEAEAFDLSSVGFSDAELAQLLAPDGSGGDGFDAMDEWHGMPAFNQPNRKAWKTIPLHFRDEDALRDFEKRIGQKITPNTRFIWHPEAEIERVAHKRYVSES